MAEGHGERVAPRRPLPELTELNHPFWTGGREGELRAQRCQSCDHLVHPPALRCPHDRSDELVWETLSGWGRLESWTENLHTWFPGFDAPYVVALVSFEEDPRARVLTNVVASDPASLHAGMVLEVTFEHLAAPDGEDVWVPLFSPVDADLTELA
jgi:uncharacterized OB-fold protein